MRGGCFENILYLHVKSLPDSSSSYSAAVEGEEAQKEWREWAEAARVELDITAITARFRKGSLSVGKSPRVVVDTLDIPPHTVTYHKPEDAFTHPNPTTMMKALRWILSRVAEVSSPSRKVRERECVCVCVCVSRGSNRRGAKRSKATVLQEQQLCWQY